MMHDNETAGRMIDDMLEMARDLQRFCIQRPELNFTEEAESLVDSNIEILELFASRNTLLARAIKADVLTSFAEGRKMNATEGGRKALEARIAKGGA